MLSLTQHLPNYIACLSVCLAVFWSLLPEGWGWVGPSLGALIVWHWAWHTGMEQLQRKACPAAHTLEFSGSSRPFLILFCSLVLLKLPGPMAFAARSFLEASVPVLYKKSPPWSLRRMCSACALQMLTLHLGLISWAVSPLQALLCIFIWRKPHFFFFKHLFVLLLGQVPFKSPPCTPFAPHWIKLGGWAHLCSS